MLGAIRNVVVLLVVFWLGGQVALRWPALFIYTWNGLKAAEERIQAKLKDLSQKGKGPA